MKTAHHGRFHWKAFAGPRCTVNVVHGTWYVEIKCWKRCFSFLQQFAKTCHGQLNHEGYHCWTINIWSLNNLIYWWQLKPIKNDYEPTILIGYSKGIFHALSGVGHSHRTDGETGNHMCIRQFALVNRFVSYVVFQKFKQQMWIGHNYATPERVYTRNTNFLGPLLPHVWNPREDQQFPWLTWP